MGNGKFYYDLQSSLYSLTKIPKVSYQLNHHLPILTFQPIERTCAGPEISQRPNFVHAVIKITPVAQTFQATTNGISATVNVNPSRCDKTLLESINMIINGPAYDK